MVNNTTTTLRSLIQALTKIEEALDLDEEIPVVFIAHKKVKMVAGILAGGDLPKGVYLVDRESVECPGCEQCEGTSKFSTKPDLDLWSG